jgi:ribosomal protein S18 acetylase RimI-like enzyme
VTTATARDTVHGRLDTWPYEPDVAHLVLLDHHMVPTRNDVGAWIAEARQASEPKRAMRTGAMFPEAAGVFADVGFTTIDTLALLDIHLLTRSDRGRPGQRRNVRTTTRRNVRTTTRRNVRTTTRRNVRTTTRRMRSSDLPAIAELDRTAFGDPWGNDVRSLGDITTATPRHQARVVEGPDGLEAFAISGQSGRYGYLQRLAVHPDARRRGHARHLVGGALHWMERRGASTALVNTGVDNDAALDLYRSLGFTRRAETLQILEHIFT